MTADDTPRRRPIEANLAHALCWGAPAWILDDGPPPTEPPGPDPSSAFRRHQSWFDRVRHRRPPRVAPSR